jgi:hypothetical protein
MNRTLRQWIYCLHKGYRLNKRYSNIYWRVTYIPWSVNDKYDRSKKMCSKTKGTCNKNRLMTRYSIREKQTIDWSTLYTKRKEENGRKIVGWYIGCTWSTTNPPKRMTFNISSLMVNPNSSLKMWVHNCTFLPEKTCTFWDFHWMQWVNVAIMCTVCGTQNSVCTHI